MDADATQELIAGKLGSLGACGRPEVLREQAHAWADLGARLAEQQQRLSALTDRSQEKWDGESANAFLLRSNDLTASTGKLVVLAGAMADSHQQHADQQLQIREILTQLVTQISVTLAFVAAATLFEPMLAVAEAELALLVGTANRMVEVLADTLSGLLRFMIRTRQAIDQLTKLTTRTEAFSFGYGRLLADGTRDFAIDLMSNSSTTAIEHKPLDPAQLFMSAGISLGVGGLFGGIEGSGLVKAVDSTGVVKRGVDGLPVYLSTGEQYRKAVASVLPSSRQLGGSVRRVESGPDAETMKTYAQIQERARSLGVTGDSVEGKKLADDLAEASAEYRRSLDLQPDPRSLRDAEERALEADRSLGSSRRALAESAQRVEGSTFLLDVVHASGNPEWIRDAEQRLADAAARRVEREREVSESLVAREEAQRVLADSQRRSQAAAADLVCRAETRLAAVDRYEAWHELRAAAARVRVRVKWNERVAYEWRNNRWRQGFGSPKGWHEYVLAEGLKDFSKGFTNNAVQAEIGAANGTSSPSEIWKLALLGGAGGMARGILKGKFVNVAFPGSGLEEILWKAGIKGMDKFVRDQIKKYL